MPKAKLPHSATQKDYNKRKWSFSPTLAYFKHLQEYAGICGPYQETSGNYLVKSLQPGFNLLVPGRLDQSIGTNEQSWCELGDLKRRAYHYSSRKPEVFNIVKSWAKVQSSWIWTSSDEGMPPCQAVNGFGSTIGWQLIINPCMGHDTIDTFALHKLRSGPRGLNCTLQSSRNALAKLRIAGAFGARALLATKCKNVSQLFWTNLAVSKILKWMAYERLWLWLWCRGDKHSMQPLILALGLRPAIGVPNQIRALESSVLSLQIISPSSKKA